MPGGFPVSITAEGRRRRARVAALRRHHPDDPELTADAQRTLKAEALERHVRRALTSPTPPAQADRDRLALLLLRGESA
jgi:hypothetical protein